MSCLFLEQLPIKDCEANCGFILVCPEGADLKKASKKHDKGHLVARAVIDPGRVAEAVVQVDADLNDGRVMSRFENFLQLISAFLLHKSYILRFDKKSKSN
jgi:hypothetical protein